MKRPYFEHWSRSDIIEHLHFVLGVRFGIGRTITILEALVFGRNNATKNLH